MKRVMRKYEFQLPVEREQLLNAAHDLGLDRKATATLMQFGEVHISVYVDTKTGEVSNVKLI